MLTEILEAALPGKWTVIKRRERTNVYPPRKLGYEVYAPENFRFSEEFSKKAFRDGIAVPGRHGAHSMLFQDAEAVRYLAERVGQAIEQCPEECSCRRQRAEVKGHLRT